MKMKRRDFCKTAAGVTVGMGALAGPVLAPVNAQVIGPESRQVAEIYELQAAFHRAKTTQDINLMMSLWDLHFGNGAAPAIFPVTFRAVLQGQW